MELKPHEKFELTHWSRFGSDGYGAYVTKLQKSQGWLVKHFPVVFKTKREAITQWERYLDMLLDKKAGRI